MKAQIESCSSNSYLAGGVRGGKVQKKGKKETTDIPSGAEMKLYLNKLQEIVPAMPKNKRLSKVEVISYVIDYIHDLRETLGLPPCSALEEGLDCNMETVSSCDEADDYVHSTTTSTADPSSVAISQKDKPVQEVRTLGEE